MIIFYLSLIGFHIFMSWLCAYLYTRKARERWHNASFSWSRLFMGLFGGWFVVPEMWDNSWLEGNDE